MDPSAILLISGLPGVGKSHFVDWLGRRGWGCLHSDDDPDDRREWLWAAARGADEALLAAAAKHPAGFVVEWGFPPDAFHLVEAMIERGYNAWYFDGDPDSALLCYLRRGGSWRTTHNWRVQAAGLRAIEDRIRAAYEPRILVTLRAGPVHLPEREIFRSIFPRIPFEELM